MNLSETARPGEEVRGTHQNSSASKPGLWYISSLLETNKISTGNFCDNAMPSSKPAVKMAVAAGHLFNGYHAAIEHLAPGVLELDGSVADLKAVAEHLVELGQNTGTLRWGNVGNGHMAGQGA